MMKNLLLLLPLLISQFLFSQDETTVIFDDLELIKLSENAFVHVSYSSLPQFGRFPNNGLIFIDHGRAVMIDTPVNDSLTDQLISWLKQHLDVTVESVIPTHWHDDCLGGLNAAHLAGAQSYALQLTKELAADHNYTVPQITFNDSIIIKIGEKEVNCKFLGGGHSVDNIVVWIPSEKILFGGCMVKPLNARGLGFTDDADLTAWPNTIMKVKNSYSEAVVVVPGHGNYGGTELLDYTYNLLITEQAE